MDKDIVVLTKNKFCPLCGNQSYVLAKHNLLRCTSCKLIISPQVWKDSANVEQEEEWFENKPIFESFWLRLFQKWNNRRTWRRIRKHIPQKGQLLEIGVGNGSLLLFLRVKGFEVEGCDLARSICEYVRNTYGIEMHNCDVADVPNRSAYDVVVMNHVIEHVNNPIQFLTDVRTCMKRNAIVHIAVPNVICWQARLTGWNCYEPYHLLYFSPETLKDLVEKAGFELLLIATHDSFSGWLLAILRTYLKTYEKSAEERRYTSENVKSTWVGHMYHLAMVLSGVITFPLRCFQSAIGRGDETVLIAKPKQ